MTDKIGVLFIHSSEEFGADAAVHADLMRHLDRDRYEVHVACASGNGGQETLPLRILRQIPQLRVRPTRFVPRLRSGGMSELWGTAAALQAVVLWGWHVPPLFEAALRHPALHAVQHLIFLAAAALFWWAMLASGRAGYPVATVHLLAASLQGALLGALFLFAPHPWFPAQRGGASGFSPLEEQQLGGLVMAGAACAVYPGAALVMLARWIAARKEPRDALVAG